MPLPTSHSQQLLNGGGSFKLPPSATTNGPLTNGTVKGLTNGALPPKDLTKKVLTNGTTPVENGGTPLTNGTTVRKIQPRIATTPPPPATKFENKVMNVLNTKSRSPTPSKPLAPEPVVQSSIEPSPKSEVKPIITNGVSTTKPPLKFPPPKGVSLPDKPSLLGISSIDKSKAPVSSPVKPPLHPLLSKDKLPPTRPPIHPPAVKDVLSMHSPLPTSLSKDKTTSVRPPAHPPLPKPLRSIKTALDAHPSKTNIVTSSYKPLATTGKAKPIEISLKLPLSRSNSIERSDISSILSRSPSPSLGSTLSNISSLSRSSYTQTRSSLRHRSLTPNRMFPQTYSDRESLNLNELSTLEQSPIVFDANLSFLINCSKQSVHQSFRPTPAHQDPQTASNYLTSKIDDFLKRTDHVMEEWKLLGRKDSKTCDDETVSMIERQREEHSNGVTRRSRSVANILTRSLQIEQTLPPTERRPLSSRGCSLRRDLSQATLDDESTLIDEEFDGEVCFTEKDNDLFLDFDWNFIFVVWCARRGNERIFYEIGGCQIIRTSYTYI